MSTEHLSAGGAAETLNVRGVLIRPLASLHLPVFDPPGSKVETVTAILPGLEFGVICCVSMGCRLRSVGLIGCVVAYALATSWMVDNLFLRSHFSQALLDDGVEVGEWRTVFINPNLAIVALLTWFGVTFGTLILFCAHCSDWPWEHKSGAEMRRPFIGVIVAMTGLIAMMVTITAIGPGEYSHSIDSGLWEEGDRVIVGDQTVKWSCRPTEVAAISYAPGNVTSPRYYSLYDPDRQLIRIGTCLTIGRIVDDPRTDFDLRSGCLVGLAGTLFLLGVSLMGVGFWRENRPQPPVVTKQPAPIVTRPRTDPEPGALPPDNPLRRPKPFTLPPENPLR